MAKQNPIDVERNKQAALSACPLPQLIYAFSCSGRTPYSVLQSRLFDFSGERENKEWELRHWSASERKKLLKSLECEECGSLLLSVGRKYAYVEYGIHSTAAESFLAQELSWAEAKKLIMGAHRRHEHSDYDEKLSEAAEKIAEENRKIGAQIDTYDEIREAREYIRLRMRGA